jgi:dCMP deaminase
MLMGVADAVSLRGTCSRLQVGAVVSRDGRIIATGYNGAPAGLPHCDHTQDDHLGIGGCQVAEHAERNAVAFAARYGLALEGGEMHVTHAPCLNCARMVINAGIAKVTYRVPYRLNDGVELLTQGGVEVVEYHGDSA